MAARLPLRRAIAICVAVSFVVLACLFYLRYALDRAGSQYWTRSGYLVAWNADLSTGGEYSASFQIGPNLSDPILELEVPRAVASRMSPKELLSGLRATCRLVDSAGEMIFSGGLPCLPLHEQPGEASIRLAEFGYSIKGQCRINFTVDEGAPALQGVPHRLVILSHAASFSAEIRRKVSVFLGHAALSVAVVILIGIALTSLHKASHPIDRQQSTPTGDT